MSVTRSLRRLRLAALALALGAGVVAPAVPAAARPVHHRPVVRQVAPVDVGGLTLNYLPAPLGRASDFTYDYDDVDFVSRVWESRRPEGGWRVDLDVTVMHGARLTDGRALHDWFLDYEQRSPQPHYEPIALHGQPGWITDDQIFWLVEPGVAVSIQLDGTRWSGQSVLRTAAASDSSRL